MCVCQWGFSCAYQEVNNASFSKNALKELKEWSPNKLSFSSHGSIVSWNLKKAVCIKICCYFRYGMALLTITKMVWM